MVRMVLQRGASVNRQNPDGGTHQQRPIMFFAARVHAAALVQPRSHNVRIAFYRRDKLGCIKHRRGDLPANVK